MHSVLKHIAIQNGCTQSMFWPFTELWNFCMFSGQLQAVQRRLPHSLATDVLMANCAWEYGLHWNKDPETIFPLQQAVAYLKCIHNAVVQHGESRHYVKAWQSGDQNRILRILSWCHLFKTTHCNSLEDGAPVDFIYGCPIFKWIAETQNVLHCLYDKHGALKHRKGKFCLVGNKCSLTGQ